MPVPTVRQLYVLRHAKSSWDDPAQRDHDRPLAPRGRRAVAVIAEYAERNAIRPDLVLCSPSRRTRDTLAGVHVGGEVLIEPELYTASAGELIERLQRIPAEVGSVMVVGHNPAMQMIVMRLSRPESEAERLADVRRKFPTGALATLAFSAPWSELAPGCAELAGYVRPKALQYHP